MFANTPMSRSARIVLVGALAALPWAASGAGGARSITEWVSAKVAEQEASLRQTARPTPQAPLYRERPPGAGPLPDFVPPTSLAPLIRAVRSGVVNISTTNTASRGGLSPASRSLGSGFILSPEGYVITNNHVIEKARQIRVKLADGREFLAAVIGRDPSTDLALLKLQGDVGELPFNYLGDSDRLEVGDWVVAIGNPFGLDHSVSHGMISAKERAIGVGPFDDFIQTDALINPGNSGGPLFNLQGEVVGVNTAVVSQGQGIGFSVPINLVKDLLPNLLVNGRLARGWLGVVIHEPSGAAALHKGAVVMDVFRNSPAARAGIHPGDRVIAVNGHPIETYQQLLRRIAILAPGSRAKVTLLRAGENHELSVTLSERPSQGLQGLSEGDRSGALGAVVRELDSALASSLGVSPFSGVLISGVSPGGPAERAGLAVGDVITEVNRRRVQDLASFRAAVERRGSDEAVLIRFQRGEHARYVAVKLAP